MGKPSESSSPFRVIPIHYARELIDETIKLINEEWPRSIGARMWSLESSNDNLPTCLVLTNPTNWEANDGVTKDTPRVLAHLKLTPIPSNPSACFIESVVVWKSLRGKGIGRFLMNEAENYCKYKLKLEEIYLSTTDKEDFYLKLGYEPCPPVSIFGGPCNGSFRPVTKKKYMKKVLTEPSDDEQC
ncbi:CLUMA_CG008147, isoform A [Clunio marinus]|uniref:CLUMA_CG008147, isoform A n=1 Tax=Clunio marinus TaxID=568069 RepID=A0A1J1I2S1_9DIPT|nr:CLUMA_CG008147, isoform A [Clunio marinus]